MSLKCYLLCFQNDVSILHMCFLFLRLIREQLLSEFVFLDTIHVYLCWKMHLLPHVAGGHVSDNWDLCHIELKKSLRFVVAAGYLHLLQPSCRSWIMNVFYSASPIANNSILQPVKAEIVFLHNIVDNCKWTVGFSSFWPMDVKKWNI